MNPGKTAYLQLIDGSREVCYQKDMAKKEAGRAAGRGKEKAVPSAKSYSSPSKMGRPSKGEDLVIVGTQLPVGYLRLLDEESRAQGMGRREFVLLLHNRRVGQIIAQRAPSAPKPVLTEQELQQVKQYKLPLSSEQRKKLDAERQRVGIPTVAMYIIVLLCDWFGIPVFSPSRAEEIGVRDDTSTS
jgi:hypothetical protein